LREHWNESRFCWTQRLDRRSARKRSGGKNGRRQRLLGSERGNVTGLRGDVDECEITGDDRKAGVDVAVLVRK